MIIDISIKKYIIRNDEMKSQTYEYIVTNWFTFVLTTKLT